ncbi:MAG: hypothetical protein WC746_04630 [archaeon]|jgi:hypothetical protein
MTNSVQAEYIAVAKAIEKHYHIPVSVIKQRMTSPIPIATTGSGFTIYLVAPETKDHELLLGARRAYPGFGIMQTLPVEDFVQLGRTNRKIIRNTMGANGLIAPFFFHEEVYGKYGKEFRRAVQSEFREELHTSLKQWMERMGIKSLKDYKQKINALRWVNETEKKVVGPREQKYLQKELARVASEIGAKDPELLIFFDRAARYLADPLQRILREVHHKKLPIFFVDPDLVRNAEIEITFGATQKTDYAKLRRIFEKEFPELVKSLPGKRVMLVDDQVYAGNSKNGMMRLLGHYSPKVLDSTHLSLVSQAPEPSWRKQGLYAIESKMQSFKVRRKKVSPKVRRQISGLKSNLNRVAGRVIANARRLR